MDMLALWKYRVCCNRDRAAAVSTSWHAPQLARLLELTGRDMRLKLHDCPFDMLRVCLEITYNDETVEDVQQLTMQELYETLEAAIRAQDFDIASLL